MGTLTKMGRSPADVPRPETYYAGKGTLTRVGMTVPEGKRKPAAELKAKGYPTCVVKS